MTEIRNENIDNQQLVVLEDLNAKDVFSDDGVEKLLEKVKAFAKTKLDENTPAGREERRSLANKIARTKVGVDELGKDYVADLKAITKEIDGKRKVWRDTMDDLKIAIRKPLTDFENAEKARVEGHQSAIQHIRELASFDYAPKSDEVEKRIELVTKLFVRDFQEFAEQAKTFIENTTGALREQLAHAIKAEEDAAELEEMRAYKAEQLEKERLAKIQKEADERAEAKAQAELDAANRRAEIAEKKVAEATTPSQETPPVADEKEHKRKINNAIVQHLVGSCTLSESSAKAVVSEIATGKVPNVKINY